MGLSRPALRRLAGRGYLPDKQETFEDWDKMLSDCAEIKTRDISFDMARVTGLKTKYKAKGMEKRAPLGSATLIRKQFGTWWSVMPPQVRSNLKLLIHKLQLNRLNDEHLRLCLGKISDMYFKHKGNAPFGGCNAWRWIQGTNQFFGSATPDVEGQVEAVKEDIVSWVCPEPGDDDKWDEKRKICDEACTVMESEWLDVSSERGWSVTEFVSRISEWVANGACTSDALEGTRKTKVSMILRGGVAGIKKLLSASEKVKYRIYLKNERKKVRGTTAAPDDIWIQMAFVFPGLNKVLGKKFPTSLDGGISMKRWYLMCQALRKGCGMPLDQSGFDHVPTKDEIVRLVEWLVSQARRMPGWSSEQERVSRILIKRMREGGEMEFEHRGDSWFYEVNHGILSGWTWTAALDTILNIGEWVACCRRAGVSMSLTWSLLAFQGDDVSLHGATEEEAVRVAMEYKKCLDVHPSKFWIDVDGEFLRTWFGWDDVNHKPFRSGYPGRMIPSIHVAQRWSDGTMTAQAIVKQWSDLISRGGVRSACVAHMLNDLCGYFVHASREDVRCWLRTPKALGGAGCMTYQGGRYVKCTDKELSKVASTYADVQHATGFSDLSAQAKVQVRRTGNHLRNILGMPKSVSPAAVMQDLVSGVRVKKNAPQQRETLTKTTSPHRGFLNTVRRPAPTPPKPAFDPLLSAGAIQDAINRKDMRTLLELIKPSDRPKVLAYHRRWSRNVWIDWILGRLPTDKPSVLGVASDVCAIHGGQTWLPTGKVTRERVTAVNMIAEQDARLRVLSDSYHSAMAA
jgi:hypothetical protein